MRLLLDTHALIWWLQDNPRLGRTGYAAIEERSNDVFVSAATAWEVAAKHPLGKLPSIGALAADIAAAIRAEGFDEFAVTVAHGERAGRLPGAHRDPFDRMLIAQAQTEDLAIVSNEALFDRFGVRRVWRTGWADRLSTGSMPAGSGRPTDGRLSSACALTGISYAGPKMIRPQAVGACGLQVGGRHGGVEHDPVDHRGDRRGRTGHRPAVRRPDGGTTSRSSASATEGGQLQSSARTFSATASGVMPKCR